MLEAKGIRTCSKARSCISLNDPERLHWHLRQMDPEQRRTIENFIENYWPKSAPSRSTVIAASYAIACLAFRLKTYISVTCFLAKWIITICWWDKTGTLHYVVFLTEPERAILTPANQPVRRLDLHEEGLFGTPDDFKIWPSAAYTAGSAAKQTTNTLMRTAEILCAGTSIKMQCPS